MRRDLLVVAGLAAAGCGEVRPASDAGAGRDATSAEADARPEVEADADIDDGGADAAIDAGTSTDASTAWQGSRGTRTVADSDTVEIESGIVWWSISGGQVGFFYASNGTDPQVSVARVLSESPCRSDSSGYEGIESVQALDDASALSYQSPNSVAFGTQLSGCSTGLLVFQQGERYGVIDFLEIDGSDNLRFDYWVGEPGVTDFSNAPGD